LKRKPLHDPFAAAVEILQKNTGSPHPLPGSLYGPGGFSYGKIITIWQSLSMI
jgi:hypothetical protein